MTVEQTRGLMFAALRGELAPAAAGELPEKLGEEDAEALYGFANRFDLAHLVGHALEKSGVTLTGKAAEKFRHKQDEALYRYVLNQNEFEKVSGLFDREKIPYLPLKGAVIRNLYPEAWLRTSADIDLLIHEEDAGRAADLLERELQYAERKLRSHDVSFHAPCGAHIELHFDLAESGWENDSPKVLERVWEYTEPSEDGGHLRMTGPMVLFYHLYHMTKHMESGGCGVRPFLDLWLMERSGEYGGKEAETLIGNGGLADFYRQSKKLAEVWMERKTPDDDARLYEAYLLGGGTYGSFSNFAAVKAQSKGGKLGFLLSKIILPYDSLKQLYPVLERHPILTPVMEVRRWGRLILRGGLKKLRTVLRTTGEKKDSTAVLLEKLGLKQ